MSLTDYGFLAIVLILGYWILQLKQEVRRLSNESAQRPPELPSLTVRDMQLLQSSLSDLVSEVEQYTETQLRKMATQTQTLHILCKRLEEKLNQPEEPAAPAPPPPVPEQVTLTRVVPLPPKQYLSKHKDRDRIIELHMKGWTPDKIAEELRITKGEVQLVVNLA